MKNIKYIVFLVVLLFLNIFYVNASCTDDEILELKNKVKDIKITYKHLGKIEFEDTDEVYYNYFKLNAKDLYDDFYVMLSKNTNKLIPTDGIVETTVFSGNWDFHVYSNKCEEKISTIDVLIPTFNMYSLDPLCEGVDSEEFELCGKYYEYYVTREDFLQRVTRYREVHDVGRSNEQDNNQNLVDNIVNAFLNFINQYQLYVLIGLIVLLLILLIIILKKRKKNRGVLK